MSDEEDSDKQYEPTQHKLDEARKKGEIAKSADLTTAAGYAGFLVAAWVLGPAALLGAGAGLSVLLGQADGLSRDLFGGRASPFMGGVVGSSVVPVLPLLLIPGAFAVLSIIAQRGFVVAPSKLAPKLSRLSLIKNFGQKFGRSGLFEFFKSTAKLVIYGAILGAYLWAQLPEILATLHLPPALVTVELGQMTLGLLGRVLVVAFVLGALDFLFQRAEHLRKNRMSRKEIMDEHKNAEGDPMLKQQRRQRAVEIAMNQMLAEVPKASVVIVNPTHYAVALKWHRGMGTAPVCVAKGVDGVAARIREVAAEHGIPVHSDPPTARALHATTDLGAEIPAEHFRAVAAAIRFAEAMRQRARRR